MHYYRVFLLVALFVAVVLSAPIAESTQNKGRSFKIRRVRNRHHVRNGPKALRKAFHKYGWSLPVVPSTQTPKTSSTTNIDTNSTVDNGEVTATPESNDVEFLSPVTIGGQQFMMDFDTGSSDLWVFSTSLPAAQQQGHSSFDPSKSTTFKNLAGSTFKISYGDGSAASGTVGLDTVDIGGATVENQAVEIANKVTQSFVSDVNNDGLVGLGFSSINAVKPKAQKTFFDNAIPELSLPVFTADLRDNAVGSYEFGIIDSTKFSGSLATIPVDSSNGFWEVKSDRFTVGGKQFSAPGGTAIADTGTTLLLVNAAVANAYYASVPGAKNDATVGGFTFPCSAKLPDLGLGIGDSYTAVIPGKLINFQTVSRSTCFGALQSNGGSGIQIYGDVFFKSQFAVFNGRDITLSLAPHA